MTPESGLIARTAPVLAVAVLALLAACAEQPGTGPAPFEMSIAARGVGEHGGGPPLSVAFMSVRTGNRDIYVMNADSSGQVDLTNTPSANESGPDWSTNGKSIAYFSWARPEHANREIYVMNADGSDQTRLTSTSTENTSPSWSPNGQEIAFERGPIGAQQIYLIHADGSDATPLTRLADNYGPKWSPNGEEIAFASNRAGTYDIWIMNTDGGNLRQLTSNPELGTYFGIDDAPAWSPNGKQIAFRSRREGYCAIFVMNADGSDAVNLTPKPADVPASQWCNNFPSWSRNGKQIYFASLRPTELGVQLEIYRMNAADGSELTRLTFTPAIDIWPAVR